MTDENLIGDAEIDEPTDVVAEPATDNDDGTRQTSAPFTRNGWLRPLVLVVLPAVIVLLGAGAGFLAWQDRSHRAVETARLESVQAASDATVAILSYKSDTVEQDLGSASDRLTGSFLESFTDLVNKFVIPGAKEKKISTAAEVSAAASVSATADRAVALVFVNQTVTIDGGVPSGSASSVRVTLDKVDDRWLVSAFDPV
jgi:Mce-associated membrane protein